eukprot:gnl/TRDRNA2_/TRDRNA2_81761_c0_seq1.p1 gnl/TRDRNA2_/TRDRNA2_81761_c0~~gnl/TRDRNA2_/TRDRNA2_81761_c0_seq1.p1  ORF type:complete len:204 (+),score=32.80 gnl/TRDRNA2_/TRDRNA2_81761_c0_seq1:151-762(+)
MKSVTAKLALVVVVRAIAIELAADYSTPAEKSVNELLDILFSRVIKARSFHHISLDSTALAKLVKSDHFVAPSARRAAASCHRSLCFTSLHLQPGIFRAVLNARSHGREASGGVWMDNLWRKSQVLRWQADMLAYEEGITVQEVQERFVRLADLLALRETLERDDAHIKNVLRLAVRAPADISRHVYSGGTVPRATFGGDRPG